MQSFSPLQEALRCNNRLAELKAEAAVVQAECPHTVVVHGQFVSPLRVCAHCGLVEAGSDHSTTERWSRRRFDGLPYLGNESGRTVQNVDTLTISRMRILEVKDAQ